MNGHLYRSRDDRILAGVAGGLAELWDADPSLIRIVWAVLVLLTGGLALVVYIIMAIVVPEEDGGSLAGQAIGWTGTSSGLGTPPAPADSADPATAAGPATGPDGGPVGPIYQSSVPGVRPPPTGWVQPRADARAMRRAARAEARAARRAARGWDSRSGAVIVGLVLILIGAFYLVREYLPTIDFDWFWPLVLVGLGVVVLVLAIRPGPGGPGGDADRSG